MHCEFLDTEGRKRLCVRFRAQAEMEAEASSDEEHFRTKEYRRLDRDRAALNPMILGKMEGPCGQQCHYGVVWQVHLSGGAVLLMPFLLRPPASDFFLQSHTWKADPLHLTKCCFLC